MKGERYFEIPNDLGVMVKVVESVPSNWSYVNGGLTPPDFLLERGRIALKTGFLFDQFPSIHSPVVGTFDPKIVNNRDPDLLAILADQKLPEFVRFQFAGQDSPINLDFCKTFACRFLRKGYRGGLHFYKFPYDSDYDDVVSCSISFKPWVGIEVGLWEKGKETGPQPARVVLKWDEDNRKYQGREEDLAPIINTCLALKLTEYAILNLDNLDKAVLRSQI